MSSQAVAGGGDDPEIYMLAESRRIYKQKCPPFVFTMSRRTGLPGERRVVMLANNDGRYPSGRECQKRTEVVCHVYAPLFGFWLLDLDGARMIVKGRGNGRGASYMIWWGSVEGFGEKAIAFSNRATHVELAAAAATTETERERKARRESQRLCTLQKQKGRAPKRPSVNNNATAHNPSLPTPSARTSPTPSTVDSLLAPIPMKRERSDSRDPTRQPPEASQRRPHHRSRSPSVIEISHSTMPSIDRYKQSHTTLHISVSTKDYGGIPIYLNSCLTIETFFASALAVWGLEGKDREVEAVTVKFDWLKEEGPMVVRRQVMDSFQKMLERIVDAPVWRDADEDGDKGRKGCDVRVKIIMKQE